MYKKLVMLIMLFLPNVISSARIDPLQPWYNGYNHKYFRDELPQTVIITHDLTDDRFRATTTPLTNGWYRIDFNKKYGYHQNERAASTSELLTLLHESCHVQIFVSNDEELNDHGPKFQSCMHHLAEQKAFDDLW